MNFKYNPKLKVIAPIALALILVGGFFLLRSNTATQFDISADLTTTVPGMTTFNTCGMDIALVMDTSDSITPEKLTQMKTALTAFVDSFLPSTPTQFSLTTFSDTATVKQPFTSDLAVIKAAINSATVSGNTNWQDGLLKAKSTFDPRPTKGNLILFASDGSPNVYNDDGSGQPYQASNALPKAILVANSIKADGTKIIGLAIGSGADIANFKMLIGPNVSPIPIPIGFSTDIISTDFGTMSASLSTLYASMCSSRIVVQKQVDINGDGIADIDGSETSALLAGDGFSLAGPTSSPKLTTDQTGTLQFTSLADGSYSVAETPQEGFTLSAIRCLQNDAATGTVDLTTRTVSGIPIIRGDNAYCTFLNQATSLMIGLSESVSPTGVAIGGGNVAFSYSVTNPSSVPLSQISISDSACSPVSLVSGDLNGDNILQNTETWSFGCNKFTDRALTSNTTVTGSFNGRQVSAQSTASISIIPAGAPVTGGGY